MGNLLRLLSRDDAETGKVDIFLDFESKCILYMCIHKHMYITFTNLLTITKCNHYAVIVVMQVTINNSEFSFF